MPPNDVVSVELPDIGRRLDRWKSYSYNSDYLTPTDGWHFTLGDDETGDELLRELTVGQRLTLVVNGVRQGDGYIDSVDISTSRGSGTEVSISGRDMLGPVVDACIDPNIKFAAGQTLADVLRVVFGQYGFTKFAIDNIANLGVLTGQTRGVPVSKTHVTKRGKVTGGAPLKSYVVHQLKPQPKEGAFAFAARISQRHGLWISLAADCETIIVSKPNFDQLTSYSVIHRRTGDSMVLHGSVTRSAADQPSCIVATGRGGGGQHDASGMRVIAINACVNADVSAILKRYGGSSGIARYEYTYQTNEPRVAGLPHVGVQALGWYATKTQSVGEHAAALTRQALAGPNSTHFFNDPFLKPVIERYPGARVIVIGEKSATRYKMAMARPVFMQDQASSTLAELENFARREMALLQRKAFEVHYTVQGHAAEGCAPWTVDTMVAVDDDVHDIHESLYVMGRTFNKSRSGTTTDLHLIRPHTLEF